MAGPNRDLPPLPVWAARSTYAVVLASVIAIMNVLNLDLYTLLGRGEEEVLDAMEGLVLLGSIVWYWIERRAPNRRLVAYPVQKEDTHDVYETETVRGSSAGGSAGPSGVWFLSSSRGGEGSGSGDSGGSGSAGDGGS